jgi:hypothetical protein
VARPRRAWREVVPSRLARLRDDLIASELAFDEAVQALGNPPRPDLVTIGSAVSRALTLLRDGADALDDAIEVLPSNRISSLHLEALRDELRDQLVMVELVVTMADNVRSTDLTWRELGRAAALPAIDALRVRLSKIEI